MTSAAGFAFAGPGFYLTDWLVKNAHRGEAPPDAKAA
jgi:predicted nucleic acid-binding Zn ribbon protein